MLKRSKKILSILLLLSTMFNVFATPVLACQNRVEESTEGTEGTESFVSKKAYKLENDGEYKIELKVPGENETQSHDEVILMVDGSYSLDEEWPAMKKAILELGSSFLNGNGNTMLTLMAFGMGDNEVLTHVKEVNELENALGELPGTLLYGRSSTNCEAGFTGVMEYIENHDDNLNDVYVVYITDGRVNTDETPYTFYNWRENTWLFSSEKVIIEESIYYETLHIANGGNKSNAFISVFGEDANVETVLKTATEEQLNNWADLVWDAVYENAGLNKEGSYSVSDAERAFVDYDNKNNTHIQELFYYTLYKRSYPDKWTRTPEAGNKLAAMEKVKSLYMVDYDSYSSWMDTDITAENSQFIQANGIVGLIEALKDVIENLSKTTYNDIVVTDYMSKWVNLDLNSIAIVDDTTDTVIYTVQDGWLIDESERPTSKEEPVKIELVESEDYEDGGYAVKGNTNGDIYKLTWYVKNGTMLRSENYHLEYNVTMDTLEKNFKYGNSYPTNGNTTVTYVEANGNNVESNITVPKVKIEKDDNKEEVDKKDPIFKKDKKCKSHHKKCCHCNKCDDKGHDRKHHDDFDKYRPTTRKDAHDSLKHNIGSGNNKKQNCGCK